MIILQTAGLDKYLGGQQVLKEINFTLLEGEKVGLVGVNGSGKSTFLKCLTGNMWLDAGSVLKSPHSSIAYLEQVSIDNDEISCWDFVMDAFRDVLEIREQIGVVEEQMESAGDKIERLLTRYARLQEAYEKADGYASESFARRILSGLGFSKEDFTKPLAAFSGGQKTRLKLARLLAAKPDCLLLDEPTNHLDMTSVEWLEQYLIDFSGTLLLVSHDRMLLDKVPTRIVEIYNGVLYSYPGNYTGYLKQRAEQALAWEKAYKRQQQYIKKTEEFITRYKAGVKAKQARGRESQLKRLDRMEKPRSNSSGLEWKLPEVPRSGEDIVQVKNLTKSFSENKLFSNVNFHIRRRDKVALLGPNGCGKSTLLRILLGMENADCGEIQWGSRIRIGYFAQENEDLNPANNLVEEILHHFDVTVEQARTYLGSIMFSGDDVFKKVGSLSGGEKGRLSLLKVLLNRPNFLILDEPTNHLDIDSRQVVEDILISYPGSLLVVSHDRFFIDQVCERLLVIENRGLNLYWGDYTYYHEKQQQSLERSKAKKDEASAVREDNSREPAALRPPSPYTIRFKLKQLEERIEEWENEKSQLECSFTDPDFLAAGDRVREEWENYEALEARLEKAYDEWESLIAQLEGSE